jgi:predicted DNA-binding transcriptional regulator AlpA
MAIDRFVSIAEMTTTRGVSIRTIYRQIDDKFLPPLRSFGRKRRGWYLSDLEAVIAAEKAAPLVTRAPFYAPATA